MSDKADKIAEKVLSGVFSAPVVVGSAAAFAVSLPFKVVLSPLVVAAHYGLFRFTEMTLGEAMADFFRWPYGQ